MVNIGRLFTSTGVKAVEKELAAIARQEKKLRLAKLSATTPQLRTTFENKIPLSVYNGVEKAFRKAFLTVFDSKLVEKSCNKDGIIEDYEIRQYAVSVRGRRKELRQLAGIAKSANTKNILLTTAEGIGLGALGIGLPDIVVFIGVLLKGVYETALSYGFTYETPEERLLILKLLAASLANGEEFDKLNGEIDNSLKGILPLVDETALNNQIEITAKHFAVDMLLLKTIQGLPIVGVVGGAGNPVYYRRIMKYVELKYAKRYLLNAYDEALTTDNKKFNTQKEDDC